METSITSETISQQTICGDSEHLSKDCKLIEIVNDNEAKQAQGKEQMTEIVQTRKNLMQAQKTYFKYFSSQKMTHTNATVRRRAETVSKSIPTTPAFNIYLSIPSTNKDNSGKITPGGKAD